MLHVDAYRSAAAVLARGAHTIVLAYRATALLELFALSADALSFAMLAVRAAATIFAKVLNFVVRAHIFAALLAVGALPQMNAHTARRLYVTTFTRRCIRCGAFTRRSLAAAALPCLTAQKARQLPLFHI